MRNLITETAERVSPRRYFKWIILSLCTVVLCCAVLAFTGIFWGFAPGRVASADVDSYTRATDNSASLPSVLPAALGTGEENDGLSYNGKMQAAVKFDTESVVLYAVNWTDFSGTTQGVAAGQTADWLDTQTNPGTVSVLHAGDYIVRFALKSGVTEWSDGTTGIKTLNFTVNRYLLNLDWNLNGAQGTPSTGYRILYDGLSHGLDATVSAAQSMSTTGWDTKVSVRYQVAGGTGWSSSKPVSAGTYTVRASLANEYNDYTATTEYQFEIIKRTVTIKWGAAGLVNTEPDNMHFIYNGMVHRLSAEPVGTAAVDSTADKLAISVGLATGGASATFENVDETLRPVNAGEYSAFAKLTGSAKDNYILLDGSGTETECAHQVFKITPREVSVLWAKNPENSSYVWVYSGLADKTTFVPALEKQSSSSSGDTGVVTGESLTLTVTYATVTGGVAGEFDGTARVDVGFYKALATQTNENYVLVDNEFDFEITKRQVAVEWSGNGNFSTDGEIIVWRYDGAEHAPSASATAPSAGTELTSYIQVTGAESEVTSLSESAYIGYYEATANFAEDVPDSIKNNYTLINVTSKFRIDKALVTGVKWFRPGDGEAPIEITSSPSFEWGTVTGAGPGFTAEATAIVKTSSGEKEIKFALVVSYPGASYPEGESWAVNTQGGYTAFAALSGLSTDGSENSERFELKISGNGGKIDACDSIKFFITKEEGELVVITVTWVVFIDSTNTNYIELDALNAAGGATIGNDGYVSVVDGKFTFMYNGKAQSPMAIYKHDDGTYETLTLGEDSRKTAAGSYTAYLKPSSEYNYQNEAAECAFTIAPLNIKLNWGKLSYEYDGKVHRPTPTLDTTYINAQPAWYQTIVNRMKTSGGELYNITTTGATDAGEYDIKTQIGGNFAFADGTGTAKLIITPYRILTSAVVWKFDSEAKNDTTGQNADAWYWNYDGDAHAPVPTLSVTITGLGKITFKLKTVGAASAVGEHFAFAWLDPDEPLNRNYILVASNDSSASTQARCKFTIAPMIINTIYWTGEAVAEGETYDGATVEIDGVTYKLSTNGEAILEHVFDGSVWAPKAFYKVGENFEEFTVGGGERNVGRYYAQIVGDYNLKDASGNELDRKCGYKIVPKAVGVNWQQAAEGETLKFDYNGKKQSPAVTGFTGGIEGEEITYEVTGYADAGSYRAEIKITNGNYTYEAGTNVCDFIIVAKTITVGWTYKDNDGMNGDLPYWQYNSESPEISVSEINGVEGLTLNLPDLGEVTFTFDYIGLSSIVGAHTVKAVIKSATLNGTAISKDNFVIADEGNKQEYDITVFKFVVKWTGNTENEGKFEWTYDGNAHRPKAEYQSWDGEWYEADVSGERTAHGTYTAIVQMPAEYVGNCVFKEGTKTECSFVINKAKVTVKWTFDGAIYNNVTDEYELVYDGKVHAPKAFIDGTSTELTVTGEVAHAGNRYIASAALNDPANYEFEDKENSFCYFTIKIKTVKVRWVDDSGNDTPAFSWYFSPNVERSPKAVVVNEDGTDFLIDGKLVYAIVSGGATHAGKNYVATAEIASSDYAFPEGETFTQIFHVLQIELSGSQFEWTDADKLKDGWYEYIFNGQSQYPLAQTTNFTEFSYEFVAVDSDKKPVGATLDGITDAGTYKITIEIVNNSDYCIPKGKETVYVRISPKTVRVEWSEDSLVYNGENQKPTAYYVDVNNAKCPLTVNVAESEYKYAGIKYNATAEFILADNIKNYVLESKSASKTYQIARRTLPVKWGETEFSYDGKGHYALSDIDVSNVVMSDFIDAEGNPVMGISFVIKDKDGKIIYDEDGIAVRSVKNAGEYTIVLSLTGPDAVIKNYELKDDDGNSEQSFIISRNLLVITVENKTVTYREEAPVFTVIYGEKDAEGETVNTFIGETEADIEGLVVDGKRPWVKCSYSVGNLPKDGGYEIYVDLKMLAKLLPNYDIKAVSGKLTVNVEEGMVFWYGDKDLGDDPNFEYDGKEHLPEASLYNNSSVPLTVSYVDKDGNPLTGLPVEAGTYYAKATTTTVGVTLKYDFISFEIKPREITINIKRVDITYGDRTINTDGTNLYTDAEKAVLWEYANEKRLLNGDELTVSFTWNVMSGIKNGYLNVGEYYIEGHAAISKNASNYKVIFVGLGNEDADEENAKFGLYVVNKADIIDDSKPSANEWFTDGRVLVGSAEYKIGIASAGEGKKYKYLTFAGDQTAEATFSYSDVYPADGGNAPYPDANASYPHTDINEIAISESGTFIINYRVEIDNHNVLYGRWIVTIGHGDDTIIVVFLKQFTVAYGDEVPENLAETLVDGGYIQVSGAITDTEYFKSVAEAYVPTGYNQYVTNRTNVGKYDIYFRIDGSAPESELNIIYKNSNQTEDTNVGAYTIAPRRIYIDWGQMTFKQDGNVHMPKPVLSNFVTAEAFTLTDFANGKVYQVTDAGVVITFTVTASGDFKSNGGHTAAISVDNGNYVIELVDSVKVVTINSGFPWWIIAVAGAVVLALLILFIIIFKRKKKKDEEDDELFDESFSETNES